MYSLWDGLWTSAFRVGHSDVEVTRYPECAHSFLRWQSTSRTRSSRLYVLHVPSRTHISLFITNCIHRIARSMFNVVRNVLIVTFLVYFTSVQYLCNETTAKTLSAIRNPVRNLDLTNAHFMPPSLTPFPTSPPLILFNILFFPIFFNSFF